MILDTVLVNYRSGHMLPQAIAAARRFAPESGLILVDNSPGDGAAELVRHLLPEARILTKGRNVGFAGAVNQAFRVSEADVCLLLNPDITEISGTYAELERLLEHDPNIGAVTPRLLNTDGSVQASCFREPRPFDYISEALDLPGRFPSWRRPKRFRMLDWDYEGARDVDSTTGACLFLRRAALEDVGLFDERFFFYWEETDWLVRAKRRGWRTVYLPSIGAVHLRWSSSDLKHDELDLYLIESQHRYVEKHFGPAMSYALRGALAAIESARYLYALRSPAKRGKRRRIAAQIAAHMTGRARQV